MNCTFGYWIIMTAYRELQQWIEQHRLLDTPADRAAFFQNLLQKLERKNENSFKEGLVALLSAVRSTQIQAEKQVASAVSLQVFPQSPEETKLLRLLLDRLAIPFKMSA
jgi:hypothetical protein